EYVPCEGVGGRPSARVPSPGRGWPEGLRSDARVETCGQAWGGVRRPAPSAGKRCSTAYSAPLRARLGPSSYRTASSFLPLIHHLPAHNSVKHARLGNLAQRTGKVVPINDNEIA